jgi:hypothetical protein
MTVLTASQVYDWYKSEGGPDNRSVAWLSVALAESSWNTGARSPTGAVGLYQFEPYSWPANLGSFSLATDPGYNTLAMLDLSGGGANFAPWDTAYANIYASGRYAFLNWPEQGSAAWNNMGWVAAQLTGVPFHNPSPPGQPGLDGTLPGAIGWYRQVSGAVTPALAARLHRTMAVTARLYTGRR